MLASGRAVYRVHTPQTELEHEGSGSGAAEERGVSNYGPLLRQQLAAAAAAAALALALCAMHAARPAASERFIPLLAALF